MEENKELEVIDLKIIFKKIWAGRKLFYKVLPITFVISCLYILCIPRTYTSSLSLAPELNSSSGIGGTLGSLASSFGFDLDNLETSDAINPMLYPDLMDDNGFIVGLFDIKVKSLDEKISCNYYDYLTKYQDQPFWIIAINSIKNILPKEEDPLAKHGTKEKRDPYILPKAQDDIAEKIRDCISISFDKKTAIISITAKAQDAFIAKTLCDSIKERLQIHITNYRTSKARIDELYYKELMAEAKKDYECSRRLYGAYSDANTDVVLKSFQAKQNDLENDMQLTYNTYSTLVAQYQAAKAKVQERTPAFTIVKGASVAVKASSPKRMIFVAAMLFLAFIITSLYIIKEDIKNLFNI